VAKPLKAVALTGLDKKIICIRKGTPYEQRIVDWFTERHFARLASTIVASGKGADYMMMLEIIAKDPLGAFVRDNDEEWSDVVRWTLHALQEAEERGIASGNATILRNSKTVRRSSICWAARRASAKRSASTAPDLQHDQAGREPQRDLRAQSGAYSHLKFARGANARWNNGGIMYPMPVR
jgi:general L-amino acid transport system substrate-binding protein